MLDHITEDINMQDTILTVYQLFIFNVFLDSIRAMLKGFLRGLGIQNSVLPYHIFIQGAIMPGAISVLCFNMPSMEDTPVLGAWIATTICDFLLFLGYFITLQRANWHEISINVVKRVNQIAGTNPDEDVFDDNGEHIEM
jgi:Na+-driven multidrug efflux pump